MLQWMKLSTFLRLLPRNDRSERIMGIQTPTPPKEKADRRTDAATTRRLKMIKARNKRISLIAITLSLCVVVLAGILTGAYFLFLHRPQDDGKILPNVYVGGVNIGSLSRDDAKTVIQLTLIPTLTGEDMQVKLPNDTLRLSPSDIGISLDIDDLVDAAYTYGRTGSKVEQSIKRVQAENREYHLALLPYLNIDLDYVWNAVKTFCNHYQADLIEPSVQITGERPVYGQANGTSVQHQTLTVTMGSPKSDLSPDAIYARILDGYSMMDLELEYEAPIIVEPQRPNAQEIFDEYCQLPKDAVMDKNSFEIIPEEYGYGFPVESLQRMIDTAEFGQVIEITMGFLLPDITENALNTNLFKDTLSSYVSYCNDGSNKNRDANLQLSCEAINGYVIKVGESFDFNKILGPRTTDRGYRNAPIYSGSTSSNIGGGINQTASALYYCALQAGLTIDERHAHRYAVTYTPLGTDASITYGAENLVFTNNTSAPIRILATAEGSTVSITFQGTDTSDYTLKFETAVIETFAPTTVYQYMVKDNAFGYVNGQVTQTSQVGYSTELYICLYDKQTGELVERRLLETARYESRDRIVIRIESGDPEESL